MDKYSKRITQKADKYARNRNHVCLAPGCKMRAIHGHAISRSLCVEGLAKNGILYSRRISLMETMRMASAYDPPEIVQMGVNDAGLFKGYCQAHDSSFFAAAEASDVIKKKNMFVSLFLRALSVEFCRKRLVRDFEMRISELTNDPIEREEGQEFVNHYNSHLSIFQEVFLRRFFGAVESIEYFFLPIARNLQISCCGCFDGTPGSMNSIIGYNLISYSDMSLLILSTFTSIKHHLDSFIGKFSLPAGAERLINDIAFFHCEEPLISPPLWRSLNGNEKLALRRSLRHPDFREETSAPRVIKLTSTDFMTKLSPAVLARMTPPPSTDIRLFS